MRARLTVIATTLFVAVLPAFGQSSLPRYKLEPDKENERQQVERKEGQDGLYLTARCTVIRNKESTDTSNYLIRILEDDHFVMQFPIEEKARRDMSIVLAMDVSGSMDQVYDKKNNRKRIDQAKQAADVFFQKLPAVAQCGLILFDHEMKVTLEPPADRKLLRDTVQFAMPLGGTAYLDAADRAIQMLSKFPKREKAIVLMTDGVDLNSTATAQDVIKKAKLANVRIYTVGIGEPGKQEEITSVLTLDISGSMEAPADDQDKIPKIKALKRAAARFLRSMSSTARTTLLPFGSKVAVPEAFTNNKIVLNQTINDLKTEGETALFDATYAAVSTLEAERPVGKKGKRVVVALTDGIDNSSRRRVGEVIDRAKEAKIPLYLLGFGRTGELDEKVMTRMAAETGGQYYHAKNEKSLIQIFEKLSMEIHDDGIDEKALKEISDGTNGKYYSAKDVSKLQFILETVTRDIENLRIVKTFKSLRQVNDGLPRKISIQLVREGSNQVVQELQQQKQVRGLVIAEMNPVTYLGLALVVGALLVVPAALKSRRNGKAG
jgi:Mg-chelatase subunit ChlD